MGLTRMIINGIVVKERLGVYIMHLSYSTAKYKGQIYNLSLFNN